MCAVLCLSKTTYIFFKSRLVPGSRAKIYFYLVPCHVVLHSPRWYLESKEFLNQNNAEGWIALQAEENNCAFLRNCLLSSCVMLIRPNLVGFWLLCDLWSLDSLADVVTRLRDGRYSNWVRFPAVRRFISSSKRQKKLRGTYIQPPYSMGAGCSFPGE